MGHGRTTLWQFNSAAKKSAVIVVRGKLPRHVDEVYKDQALVGPESSSHALGADLTPGQLQREPSNVGPTLLLSRTPWATLVKRLSAAARNKFHYASHTCARKC